MEFRLTYAGRLLSHREAPDPSRKRTDHKHDIRKEFHVQLKNLWEHNPNLAALAEQKMPSGKIFIEHNANYYEQFGFRWLPLVTKTMHLLCKLEILMLRPGAPGGVRHDIDNRLKTIFDALKMPSEKNQLGSAVPGPGEDPFFVLLQDDSLITHAAVETDMLLQPVNGDNNDVRLVLTVNVRLYNVTLGNLEFAA